jgi:hypothetical protein
VAEVSATIYWEPVVPMIHEHLSVMAPQWFMAVLQELHIELPHEFSETHLPILRGMAAAAGKNREPFIQLIAAIEKHGTVRVWVEY